MRKLITLAGSVVAAVFLGALGSGLWEKLLAPFLSWSASETVALVSRVSTDYENSIYQTAARDTTDLYSKKIAFLILLIFGLVLVVQATARIVARRSPNTFLHGFVDGFVDGNGLVIGLTLLTITFFSMAKIDAAARIKERSLRSMEILRPDVGESEYFRLRAHYYSINGRPDFQRFSQESLLHSRRLGVKIPLAEAELAQ